ncbi:MAG: dihydrofolate reductase [Betaproteobacteria bacterium]|nr:MAG: dihydrofolate reductase [Betaproteobacteria bacterium]
MRRLVVSTMISLDGVMQAPGAPEEDPTGGFTLGGWTVNYWGDDMGDSMMGLDGKDRDLVLGRKTYEIFEAYWPYQPADNPIARSLNAARKYVASRTLKTVGWNNSTLLGDDVVASVAALKKESGNDLQIIGSSNLIQVLQAASLIDEYNVLTFPVVLGAGKRLFESGAKAQSLRLVSSKASGKGVLLNTYAPAGDVQSGSFAPPQPSSKEIERRAKMAREAR